MFIVVDVNVVLSSLLTKGDSFNVFALNSITNKFTFIAPEFLIIGLESHKKEIEARTKMPSKEFKDNINFVLDQINLISDSEFKDKIEEANKILVNHNKDSPYLAMALKFKCQIFSGDKEFKKRCPAMVLNPKEMLDIMY
ncbi:hypothetical protein COU57_04430 [Candidatus Pacearchaeota archaeon CG10_big_fil_rev_8_21_14_0_10_32_14]|nr:MAG: hypothetical protein COU57_04430 [Candidatus Pacearchaeota archaeon CG10_big_fil_rev_8_21_14_0_10_32_14]